MAQTTTTPEGIPDDVMREALELCQGAEVLPEGATGLARRLMQARAEGRVLRVKFGVDPTSSDLHLGHAVGLRALARFQSRGHEVILVIGGFTAQIGDPTGRNTARPALTPDAVAANAKTYLDQVGLVLDLSRATVMNNASWLAKVDLTTVIKLASLVTVNQLIAKEGFGERLGNQQPVGMHELFYPVLQGFDSVEVQADVEIGGTDQRFNILMGRALQPHFGQLPQMAMFLPLLEGTDGVRKMSKSLGNSVQLTDAPDDMFAKIMRIPDGLIIKFFELATNCRRVEIDLVKEQLAEGGNPKDAKEHLAYKVVMLLHGVEAAVKAKDFWQRVHSKRLAPEGMPSFVVAKPTPLVDILKDSGLSQSKNRARQDIRGNGVRIDNEKVQDVDLVVAVPPAAGQVLQVGHRKFVRLVPGEKSA